MKAIDERALGLLTRAGWLGPRAPKLAALLVAEGRLVRLEAGAWAYGEGDEQTGLLLVVKGALQMYCQAPGDREVLISHAEAGAALGQSVRFGGGPRLVTAICPVPSVLLLVSDTALERIAVQEPAIWRAMARLAYGQLGTILRVFTETIVLPPRQRLAARLVMLSFPQQGAGPYELKLGQAALAEMTGVSRKTANAYLAEFEEAGAIETGYRRIIVRDRSKLSALAES